MSENVGGVSWVVDADTKGATNSIKQVEKQSSAAEKSLKGLDSAAAKTEKSFKRLDAQTTKTASGVKKGISGMGRSAGQAGIQLQQFVGQIQGGQNAMLALSQQSADLGFVLGAPLVGAVVGISASLIGLLVPSLADSTTEAKKLEKAIEALDKMTYEASDGTLKLSESIAKLAGKSKEAAKVELALGIVEAKQAILTATKEISEASTEWESFFSMSGVSNATGELKNLESAAKRTGETQAELLERLGDTYEGNVVGIGGLSEAVGDIGDKYGMTTTQSLGFLKAIKQVNETQSPKAMQALSVALSDIALSAKKPNKELLGLAKRINTASVSATNAGDVVSLFEKALKDLDAALVESGDGFDKHRSKVQAMADSLAEEAKQIGETSRQTAVRIATENKATEAQLISINASFDKIEALEKEKKAQKSASEEAKKNIALETLARKNAFKEMDAIREAAEKEAEDKKKNKDTAVTFTENIVSRGEGTDEKLSMEKAKIDKFLDEKLINAKQHEDALTQIEREGEAARLASISEGLGAASNLFGSMADLVGSFGSEQSNAYKAMFALSKGFAIAQAGLNLSMAVSNASAITPWYASIPAVTKVMSSGAALVSSIASASYGGREHGGSVMAGQTYEMGEKNKPEMLVIPGNDGKVFSNSEMKSMMGGGGSGGGAPTINNYAAGNGVSVSHRRDELTQRDVFDIVQGEMGNPNSVGRRNLGRTSNVTGVLNGSRR